QASGAAILDERAEQITAEKERDLFQQRHHAKWRGQSIRTASCNGCGRQSEYVDLLARRSRSRSVSSGRRGPKCQPAWPVGVHRTISLKGRKRDRGVARHVRKNFRRYGRQSFL